MSRLRIMPLLIFVAMLAFSVRLAGVFIGNFPGLSGEALAQQEVHDAEPPPLPASEEHAAAPETKEEPKAEGFTIEDDTKKPEEPAEGEEGEKKGGEVVTAKEPLIDWKDAGDSDLDFTATRMEIFEDLSKRRQDIEKREQEMMSREALLKAAEQEIDRKYQELDQLRAELERLLQQQSTEETARIDSLVKIYEGMKPKDAARIFDTLDLDVLVAVTGKMSERKISPILAAMNPERARTITIMLAEQKQLPELPESN
jgi:flagellar motility protein MotE (MotC chaperone)